MITHLFELLQSCVQSLLCFLFSQLCLACCQLMTLDLLYQNYESLHASLKVQHHLVCNALHGKLWHNDLMGPLLSGAHLLQTGNLRLQACVLCSHGVQLHCITLQPQNVVCLLGIALTQYLCIVSAVVSGRYQDGDRLPFALAWRHTLCPYWLVTECTLLSHRVECMLRTLR